MMGEDTGHPTKYKPRSTPSPPGRPALGILAPRRVMAAAAPGTKP